MSGQAPGIYSIPAGVPFAEALAEGIIAQTGEKPEALSRVRILLPTRRACRTLREAFLRKTEGKPLLLPHMQPLGSIDEEELAFSITDKGIASRLPGLLPAIPPLKRQILLAQAVMSHGGKDKPYEHSVDHAMALAKALGQLIDHIHTESLDIRDLPTLVDEEFAAHWDMTLDFLKILSEKWPEILESMGYIDGSLRCNRLLQLLTAHWTENPPQTPVIAAGTTGSIPATANLLKVILGLPQGKIVLPGLNTYTDTASWDVLTKPENETHPQATLRHLLDKLEVTRDVVKPWPGTEKSISSVAQGRNWLSSELMRPTETARAWQDLKTQNEEPFFTAALQGLSYGVCETPQEEARVIAIMMREVLETPGKTAALVTPDRQLARRVAMVCRRWNIVLDDSGGRPLSGTVIGSYIRTSFQACLMQLRPGALLAFLRHKHCRLAWSQKELRDSTSALEIKGLRGPVPPEGLEGLRNHLEQKDREATERQGPQDKVPVRVYELLDKLESTLAELFALCGSGEKQDFTTWLVAHIKVMEVSASSSKQSGASRLWQGDDGEAAAVFLAQLQEQLRGLPKVSGEEYLAILEQLMANVIVRPAYGTHPRLAILGQLEARLLQADLVILGGLNEGTWPPDAGYDPWMSRPMKRDFGLPAPERQIGLSAHDFEQGFCAPHVVLTRSRRLDGAPTVPARWIQRLEAVLQAAGHKREDIQQAAEPYLQIARQMDFSATQEPCQRPKPAPPLEIRPRKLSVTRIEKWLQDPYSVYAQSVLRLRKLDRLEKQPDAAEKGNLIHHVMEKFIAVSKESLPDNARGILLDLGRDEISRRTDDPAFWEFWWPRFINMADWFIDHEETWRQKARPLKTEVKGAMTIKAPAGEFTVTAHADRIDQYGTNGYAIIDYKSGKSNYTEKGIVSGSQPQLGLEALILQEGGFDNIEAGQVDYLGYWILSGSDGGGKEISPKKDFQDSLVAIEAGLRGLIQTFDNPQTPYYSLPNPDFVPRYNDYEHLARVQEWTALDEAEAA